MQMQFFCLSLFLGTTNLFSFSEKVILGVKWNVNSGLLGEHLLLPQPTTRFALFCKICKLTSSNQMALNYKLNYIFVHLTLMHKVLETRGVVATR